MADIKDLRRELEELERFYSMNKERETGIVKEEDRG
jgi:hypothetical protein